MNEKMKKFLGITDPQPEKKDAVEERKEPESDQREHQDGDEGGQAAEAGGGDSDAKSRKVKKPARRKKG